MTRSHPTFVQPGRTLTFLLIAISMSVGCHRQFYRQQADCEAHALIDEKASHINRPPNVPIRVYANRRSRMFNPFDWDFQPMPLDDPAAYQYMQCVDGRRGYPMWEAAGLTNTAENPDWWQFLPLDEDGVLVLNSENAFRLALLHSRQYQEEIENLYLAALDVSGQRFVFDTQFFGGKAAALALSNGSTEVGFARPLTGGRTELLTLERAFATGGSMVATIANNLVWELSGPNTQSASTLVDFTLLQPLLRTAGRDKVLEDLTQSERNLLATVRAFERFRRTFFMNITVGADVVLTANSAVGPINISGTGFGAGGGGGGGAGGFLGLLQTQLQIRNSKENIVRLMESTQLQQDTLIELLTTIPDDAGQIVSQRLQVAQSRQSLISAQDSLVNQQAGFQRSIDQFLRSLGLPPYICVRLDDPFLNRFELIDRELLTRREQLSALRTKVGEINVEILDMGDFKIDPDTGLPVSQIEWTPELAAKLEAMRQELEPLAEFVNDLMNSDLPLIAQDIDDLEKALPDRRRQAESLRELYESERDNICGLLNISEISESVFEVEALMELSNSLREEFTALKENLVSYQQRIEELEKAFDELQGGAAETADPRQLAATLRDDIILASQDVVSELGDDILSLQLIQARARTESVLLPEVDIAPEVALEIARKNRRDWANARTSLVDAWRQIEVVADDLESTLDLELTGGVGNGTNNPLKLTSSTAQLRAGLRWDAPITRLTERNSYRTELINYEQSKRSYYNFEDSVWQVLRSEIRQLQANRFRFELNRQLIRNSAEQIGLNADQRSLREARGQSQGPTAARDQIQALSALLNAQNGLLGIFVNYEIVRRSLDLDLGTMELTPEGFWIDPGKITADRLVDLPGTTLSGMIEARCNDCGLRYDPQPMEPTFDRLPPALRRQRRRPAELVPLDDPAIEPSDRQRHYGVPEQLPVEQGRSPEAAPLLRVELPSEPSEELAMLPQPGGRSRLPDPVRLTAESLDATPTD